MTTLHGQTYVSVTVLRYVATFNFNQALPVLAARDLVLLHGLVTIESLSVCGTVYHCGPQVNTPLYSNRDQLCSYTSIE